MKILAIFDNGGATLDRYTFVTNIRDGQYYQMLGTDRTGKDFSQWSNGEFNYHGDNSHLGKQIKWQDIPEQLKKHVERRLA